VLVYDAGQSESFYGMNTCYEQVQDFDMRKFPKDRASTIVVRNKMDLVEGALHQNAIEDGCGGANWARNRGLRFYETSCVQRNTVEAAFYDVVKQVTIFFVSLRINLIQEWLQVVLQRRLKRHGTRVESKLTVPS
jgi:hypothetical protein